MQWLSAILATVIFAGAAKAHSEPLAETKQQRLSTVQAAILYQLTSYIGWSRQGSGPLQLCIHDDAELEQELQRLLARKPGRKHVSPDDHGACDLLFIPQQDLSMYAQITAPYRDRQVLLVSDAPGFIDSGGMVALVDRDGRIGIEINMQMVQAAHFTVNPSLIDIAIRVIK